MKCYKLIYKEFVQVSGLCGSLFPSYLTKHFTHHCRALYGDANKIICGQFWCKNMAAGNQRKHLEFTSSHPHLQKWMFHHKTLGYELSNISHLSFFRKVPPEKTSLRGGFQLMTCDDCDIWSRDLHHETYASQKAMWHRCRDIIWYKFLPSFSTVPSSFLGFSHHLHPI